MKFAGKTDSNVTLQRNGFRRSMNSSKVNHTSLAPWKRETQLYPPLVDDNVNSTANLGTCLCLSSQGNGGIFGFCSHSVTSYLCYWDMNILLLYLLCF